MEQEIICNCCGARMLAKEGIFREDYLPVVKEWGYFSEKDGKRQEFYLCEACYDKLIESFLHPVMTTEVTELL